LLTLRCGVVSGEVGVVGDVGKCDATVAETCHEWCSAGNLNPTLKLVFAPTGHVLVLGLADKTASGVALNWTVSLAPLMSWSWSG